MWRRDRRDQFGPLDVVDTAQIGDAVFRDDHVDVAAGVDTTSTRPTIVGPVLSFKEIHEHRQVAANGFLPLVTGNDGLEFRLVAPPMHFDGEPSAPAGPAPELGQHIEEVLLDAGLDWEDITKARDGGVLG